MALFIVTSTADDGAGSLRAAIEAANVSSDADTIRFAADLAGDEIQLQSTLEITQGTLTIDGDIDGDGDPDIIISGDRDDDGHDDGDLDILLQVDAGATADIRSVHFANAYARGADGYVDFSGPINVVVHAEEGVAGLRNDGNLYLHDSILSDFASVGGAAYYIGGQYADAAAGLAGIQNSGVLRIFDTHLTDLEAYGGAGRNGAFGDGQSGATGVAGVRTSGGGVYVRGSLISNSAAYGADGGNAYVLQNDDGGDGGDAVGFLLRDAGVATGIFGYFKLNLTPGDGGAGAGSGSDGADGTAQLPGDAPGLFGYAATYSTSGNDTVSISGSENFFGVQGDDKITQTSSGYGRLFGGSGNDTIKGIGTMFAYGGSGDDTIRNNSVYANARMDGGDGVDTLDTRASGASGLSQNFDMATGILRLDGAISLFATAANFENFVGSNTGSVGDAVKGTNEANTIKGLRGADNLSGRGGDDTLLGGAGADVIRGGSADDVGKGGGGADLILGQSGDDELFGGGGSDILNGGTGMDRLRGDGGNDIFEFGAKKESGTNTSTRDKILDFDDRGNDKIDLSGFRGDLIFVGTVELSGKNQVSISKFGKHVLVEVSTDNDADAEFSIQLNKTTIGSVDAGDFIL